MARWFVAGMVCAILTPIANAQTTNDTLTAAALYSACTHPPGETKEAHEFAEQTCSAYIRGLTDGLFMMPVFAEKGLSICLPRDTPVSNADARRILANYLKAHPEAAKNSAGLVAAYAIVNGYPCSGRN